MNDLKLISVLAGASLLLCCSNDSGTMPGITEGVVPIMAGNGSGNGSGSGGTAAAAPAGSAAAGIEAQQVPNGAVGSGTEGGAAPSGLAGPMQGTAGSGGSAASTEGQKWVASWTASPYPVDANNQPPTPLSNSTLRQLVHVSLGGSQLRVQFSNLSGDGPVTINSVHLALNRATGTVDSTIDAATDSALAFSGTGSVTIAQGTEVWSDPIDFTVAPLGNIAITTAFGAVPSRLTGHSGSRTTSYLQAASGDVSAEEMASALKTDHWYYICGIEVMANAAARGVVAIGDSITDGRGTDTNGNNRWTDILSARLQADATTANVAMLNQGIGATSLEGTSATSAQSRFQRDVLGQSGIRYVIVYDGVNDIGANKSFDTLKAAYDDLIGRAHAQGLLIYGATIPPFGAYATYYSDAHESVRQQVNGYVKSGAFDGVIDFDAALTDGGTPAKLQAAYAAWAQMDGLHPGPAGYQKMGETINLAFFTK